MPTKRVTTHVTTNAEDQKITKRNAEVARANRKTIAYAAGLLHQICKFPGNGVIEIRIVDGAPFATVLRPITEAEKSAPWLERRRTAGRQLSPKGLA